MKNYSSASKIIASFFLLAMPLIFSFCKTTEYTPTDFPKGQIIFGSGGGFAGTVSEFSLLENGQLFSKKGIKAEFESVKKIKASLTKQLFNNIETFGLRKVQINDPGNKYYFIQIKGKDADHKIVWNNSKSLPKEVQNFYEILNYLVQ